MVIFRFRLDNLIPWKKTPWWFRWVLMFGIWRLIPCNYPRGQRLRMALEALGPVFVKFGQLLSTRPDLIPQDLVAELCKLQDQVPPFPHEQAVKKIEQTFAKSVEQLFASFQEEPLASASVAQVHRATLHNGQSVVVKIIRPGIEKIILHDMRLLYTVSRLLTALSADIRRLKLKEVVRDYQQTLFDELDLQREAANASQLRRNFSDSEDLYIPQIYWDYCRPNVMVMEYVHGVPVSDVATLKKQNVNIKKLAEIAVNIFFTQVFRDAFFHADMHPGNILVNTDNPAKPYFIAIDFGIVGSLTPEDQSYLARNVLAFFHHDYRKVAELHIKSGWVPDNTSVHELEAAIRTVCEPVFGRPLVEISFGQILLRLFQIARRFNMEVQPQLILLEKTLINVEGIGRQLYPPLNLWTTAQPFLEEWLKNRVSPLSVIKRIHDQMPDWIEQTPVLVHQLMQKLQQQQTSRKVRRFRKDILTGSIMVGSAVVLIFYPEWYAHLPLFPVILGIAGLVLIVKR